MEIFRTSGLFVGRLLNWEFCTAHICFDAVTYCTSACCYCCSVLCFAYIYMLDNEFMGGRS